MFFQRKFFSAFSWSRRSKRLVALVVDFVLLHLAFYASLGVLNLPLPNATTWLLIAIVTCATQVALFLMGFYSAVTRYLSTKSIVVLVFAALFAQLVFKILTVSKNIYGSFWFSEMTVTAMTICVLLGGIRVVVLSFFSHYMNRQKEPVIIYGAGDSGYHLAASLLNGGKYFPIAFIDDDINKQGVYIRGIKVWAFAKLEQLIENHGVGLVMLALPKISKTERQEILTRLADYSLAVKSVPELQDMLTGKLQPSDYQDVDVDDLLGRELVVPKTELLAADINGKTVLVSGAGGSIGAELSRQIAAQQPKQLILLDASEFALYKIHEELRGTYQYLPTKALLGSVQDLERMQTVINTHQVQTIYHAAAYKHVPIVERNAIAGVMNNVFGTYAIASAATQAKVEKFVLVSTDKAVRPTNVMGASKRLAELILQAFEDRFPETIFCMVRFGNVLGSSGSVVPLFKEQIQKGGPLTVTHKDIIRYFMTIPEAAQLVIQAGAMSKGGDVFVLDMGAPVKIDQLAKRMIYLMGYQLKNAQHPQGDIEIIYTGLRPGEKLYEELLIGDDVRETFHPRIMKAQETCLDWESLHILLDELQQACKEFDYAALQKILLTAPLQFQPSSEPCSLLDNSNQSSV